MAPYAYETQLSQHDFAKLGLEWLAYVKPMVEEDCQLFAIHAADGRRIAVLSDEATAFALIREQEMVPASLH